MDVVHDLHDIVHLEHFTHFTKRERLDPFQVYNAEEFRRRFHLRKELVRWLIQRLNASLKRQYDSKRGLTVSDQVLIALRFYATGSFQIVCGDTIHVSQASISRCIMAVTKALLSLRETVIQFPDDLNVVKKAFYEINAFPGVIGVVDGTHIPIYKPPGIMEAEIYRNRKAYFSINAQITCGPNMTIYNIVSRWPGSTHDNRIFENSRLHYRLSSGELAGILLGDAGYGNKR
jgi:nuclease HARBI1